MIVKNSIEGIYNNCTACVLEKISELTPAYLLVSWLFLTGLWVEHSSFSGSRDYNIFFTD